VIGITPTVTSPIQQQQMGQFRSLLSPIPSILGEATDGEGPNGLTSEEVSYIRCLGGSVRVPIRNGLGASRCKDRAEP